MDIKKNHILENLYIQDIAFGGVGIAKIPTDKGDWVVFVENTLPGQTVTARITKKSKQFAEAKLLRVEKPADTELSVPYQKIAGAPFYQFPIALQAEFKQRSTLEMFRRLAQIPDIEKYFDGYIESPRIWHYRNKMEYSFSTLVSELVTEREYEGFALGFKRRGQWWAVENLDADSGLFDAQWESQLHRIRLFCQQSGLPAWSPRLHTGFFRYLVLRKSYANDELLVGLVTGSEGADKFDKQAFVALLQDILGQRLAGVLHTINDESGDSAKMGGENTKLLFGKEKIEETLLGLTFEISMQSFFQTNPGCAERLYSKALQYVQQGTVASSSQPYVMDLFCGTGTIAQLLSRCEGVQSVIGVDIVPEAIADAERNAHRNGISSIQFHAADVQKFLPQYPQYRNRIGTLVLDPPRAGISPKALQSAIQLNAPRIVYISCNPSTQARDVVTLQQSGYRLLRFCLIDQFPHTSHIESIALLEYQG